MKVERVETWVAALEDRPGNLATKLDPLAKAGINLEFVLARRAPEKPGTGVVFVAPIKGAAASRAAQEAGFIKTETLFSVRVEGSDKPGRCAQLARVLAEKGLNLRGLSASNIGRKFVAYVALDNAADAAKAVRVLKAI